jgi:hypothetical protein
VVPVGVWIPRAFVSLRAVHNIIAIVIDFVAALRRARMNARIQVATLLTPRVAVLVLIQVLLHSVTVPVEVLSALDRGRRVNFRIGVVTILPDRGIGGNGRTGESNHLVVTIAIAIPILVPGQNV